ncbi:hypothetical protein HanRHA438_Chr05g0235911 [Helianthus annuus]|uniref:Uncharacterized protein n=1 Tax=Helianthus annuus TaxID=4232 RepID=A0A9K3J101_HELAN|nr:hypothetical protein HanXRQr2_Chr05g0226851 [Helianthus annuus]KAJ0919988.1 hypothetical protein HanRHA438_Chr05g0235911 [Helianthus annuus]KAJ0923677.1 hypothetical protein HanPSC8_Chr05g0218861 [Helianthus annuus]
MYEMTRLRLRMDSTSTNSVSLMFYLPLTTEMGLIVIFCFKKVAVDSGNHTMS